MCDLHVRHEHFQDGHLEWEVKRTDKLCITSCTACTIHLCVSYSYFENNSKDLGVGLKLSDGIENAQSYAWLFPCLWTCRSCQTSLPAFVPLVALMRNIGGTGPQAEYMGTNSDIGISAPIFEILYRVSIIYICFCKYSIAFN